MSIIFLSGCVPYKFATSDFQSCNSCKTEDERAWINKVEAKEHPLYTFIPRHRCQIQRCDLGHWLTWTLFGNDDAGLFGEDDPHPYHPEQPVSYSKALRWYLRNPLHNLCYYVIGTAHCANSEFVLLGTSGEGFSFLKYSPYAYRNFASKGTSFYCALHGWKPFLSLRLRYSENYRGDFYCGWRYRGNFGIKFVPWTRTQRK